MTERLAVTTLFPKPPTLTFKENRSRCRCGHALKVLKTRQRTVATLDIGCFQAREIVLYCPSCQRTYPASALRQRVAPGSRFGFDVLVHIGLALFVHCQNEPVIQAELADKNIAISRREIGYLGQRFILYLSVAHQHAQPELKHWLVAQGGYILHLDGTCEGDSPQLMSGLDGITKIVLGNRKLPSENQAMIIPWLRQMQHAYGTPRAWVHDRGRGIVAAMAEVFPGVPDFICHFHFLRDLGTDLFGYENRNIRRLLKRHRSRPLLRKQANALRPLIENEPALAPCWSDYQEPLRLPRAPPPLPPTVAAYLMILWILDAKHELHGYGFPFDRAHLVFYQRLQNASTAINHLNRFAATQPAFTQLRRTLRPVLQDESLQRLIKKMQQKVNTFDQLREAMRIAVPEHNQGLNDNGDPIDIKTIKERVTAFRQSETLLQAAAEDRFYRAMLKQIDTYWEKLFADPITVSTPTGPVTIQPQRTNNILERFFRDLKKSARKKSGQHALTKTVTAMMAHTPLVKNLSNPQYLKFLLKDKANLAERFADIDVRLVQQALKEEQNQPERLPARLKKVLRMPECLGQRVAATRKCTAP